MKRITRYQEVADYYSDKTPLTPDERAARRAKAKTEQGRRRRGIAIKGTGLLLTAALVASGAPKAVHEVSVGAKTLAAHAESFGVVSDGAIDGVVASVGYQIDSILGAQDRLTAGEFHDLGVSQADREAIARKGEATAAAGVTSQQQ